MIRLSDLDDKLVRSAEGKRLGRVHDVRVEHGELLWLDYGARSLLERLSGRGTTKQIPWSAVREVGDDAIIVEL